MRRSPTVSALLAAAIALGAGGPAAGWDADETEEPRGTPFEPAPFELPDALPLIAPSGIYLVTDAYAGDYVSQDGPVTTYSTATVHGPTDTYARVIDTVATGAASVFDGSAFNGRSALTDGRPVAGTYYESFFLADTGYVSLGVVFFQDDAEIARARPVIAPPVAAPAAAPLAPSSAPSAPPAPPVSRLAPGGAVVPQIEPPATPPPATPPVVTPPATGPRFEPLAAGRVEVLRGRRVEIWLTGLPPGAMWHFIGGEAVVLGSRDGAMGDPFVAQWDRLAAPGAAWTLSFQITSPAAPAAPARTLTVEVTVRSPGLVE